MNASKLLVLLLSLTAETYAQRTIQLHPRCDLVTLTYATGGVRSVDVINLPFKVEIGPAPGIPVHPIQSDIPGKRSYRYHDGGPKNSLLTSVAYSKHAYAAELGSASSNAILCTANVWASWLSAGAQCRHDAEFLSESEYRKCLADALTARNRGNFDCVAILQRRILIAILDCDDEIDLFVQAYQGCRNLHAYIESWKRYWADEQ